MKKFHLIGQNIQTSLSPLIHNFLFQLKGLSPNDYSYSLYHEENVMLTLEDMKRKDVHGASITIPFKQSYAKDLMDGRMGKGVVRIRNELIQDKQCRLQSQLKVSAEEILAKRHIINTIKRSGQSNSDNEFMSFNTDIFGIKMCFEKSLSIGSQLATTELKKNAISVIIGGGATGEVFMSYFQELGIKMIVLNRSVDKVIQLRNGFYGNIVQVSDFGVRQQLLSQIRNDYSKVIIVNTLPTKTLTQNLTKLQTSRHPFQFPLNNSSPKSILYMDVNYRDAQDTLLTLISQSIDSQKHIPQVQQISTGLDMLIWQAILQNHVFQQVLLGQEFGQFTHYYNQVKKVVMLNKLQ